jgi:hypothetical protein
MAKSKLLAEWEAARDDLGLDIVAPFYLEIDSNVTIRAEFLVRKFGGRIGMLVVTDYAQVKPYWEQFGRMGYGFSVLDEPRDKTNEAYHRGNFIRLLSDWGWCGAETEKPDWIVDQEDQE